MLEISNVVSSLHLGVIRVTEENQLHSKMLNYLRENGIGVQVHYSPVHLQPYYRELGYKEDDYPNAERYESTCMSIPLYPGLTERQQERVINLIEECVKEQ